MKNIALLLGCLLLLTGFPQSAESAIGWITEINKGCKMWSPIDIDVNNKLSLSYAWLGDCKDGFASGKGIVKVFMKNKLSTTCFREFIKGKMDGEAYCEDDKGGMFFQKWENGDLIEGYSRYSGGKTRYTSRDLKQKWIEMNLEEFNRLIKNPYTEFQKINEHVQ